jgi:hypothetical protein
MVKEVGIYVEVSDMGYWTKQGEGTKEVCDRGAYWTKQSEGTMKVSNRRSLLDKTRCENDESVR